VRIEKIFHSMTWQGIPQQKSERHTGCTTSSI